MKKAMTLLALMVGAVSVFAQGQVNFANNVGFTTTDPAGGARSVYSNGVAGAFSGPLKGTNWVAELYVIPTGQSSLVGLPSTIAKFRPLSTTQPGKWNPGANSIFTLTGVNFGDTTTLQVRVWDGLLFGYAAGGYEAAVAGGGLTGESPTFSYTAPSATNVDPTKYFMENLQAFALVPEPSAIALGVLGIAGLLLIRRRK